MVVVLLHHHVVVVLVVRVLVVMVHAALTHVGRGGSAPGSWGSLRARVCEGCNE